MADIRELAQIDNSSPVMVLTTARKHGNGIQRLPDRIDRSGPVVAVQVGTESEARHALSALDCNGRTLYIDVERKQDLDLMPLARRIVTRAELQPIKPNDLTVDALFALLSHRIGSDLSDLKVSVVGTGNLSFKFALRLAECGALVGLEGRNPLKAQQLTDTMNLILPKFTPHPVTPTRLRGSQIVVTAVSGDAVITSEWLDFLSPHALCVDVGIGNLSPGFIREANALGHECVRLDVRSAGDPLPLHPNPFFESVAGRRHVNRATMVAGGIIGTSGDIVVDQITHPRAVIGVANGTGGLLSADRWSSSDRQNVDSVQREINASRAVESSGRTTENHD